MRRAEARPAHSRSRRDRSRTGSAPASSLPHRVQHFCSRTRSLRIVTELDLRSAARRRATWVAVGAWLVLVYGLIALALASTSGGSSSDGAGALVHSLIATAALGAGLAVVPALGANTLDRSRDTGLLDMLRVTQLSARAISWGVFTGTLARVLLLVLLTAPALLTALALGGSDISGFFLSLLVPSVVLAAVAAVAQAASARFARRTTALIVSYSATGLLALGPLLAYAALLPLTTESVETQVSVLAGTHGTTRPPDGRPCATVTEHRERTRPDRIWWLLAPQPFVILADAAPGRIGGAVRFEPLSAVRDALRLGRIAPAPAGQVTADECPVAGGAAESGASETVDASGAGGTTGVAGPAPTTDAANSDDARRAAIEAIPPTWPLGLGLICLTGAASIAYCTHRLRAPGVAATGEHFADSTATGL